MIKTRLSNIGKDIYTVISELTEDSDIINLAKVSPDFACPPELTDLGIKFLKSGYNQYAHVNGVFELREAIANQITEKYKIDYSPANEVTITAGATQAMYTAISSFINEGDEVVLFEPAYNSYIPAIESNGGRPVFVQLKYPDYSIDWEAVQKIINTRTKLIIVNTPHNPTGALFTENDIVQLQKITNGTKINVISDEVFEHIIYDGKKHFSVLSSKKLAERSIVISSFGKTYNIPGWKIGYCIAPEKLMSQIRKNQLFQVNSVNAPMQYALAEYISNNPIDYNKLLKEHIENRELVQQIFVNTGFDLAPSKSTYYQLLSYKNISEIKDTEFAREIMDKYGVALFPMSVFYHDAVDHKILGMNFSLDKDVLIESANRLKKI
ncbi:MAG: methionine aminotransferase [Thiohalospira sp.]